MTPDILSLVCDPGTHDALEIREQADANGRRHECFVNPRTNEHFRIRDGIPIFLREGEVTGANQRYQRMYDRLARFYDFSTWVYSRWQRMSIEPLLRQYLDELEIRAGDRVLEVSVGTGRNLQFLNRAAQFFGLDISYGMLKRCQRNATKWKLDVPLFLGMAERLPFRDEVFDVVFHFGGINFFNDRAAAMREMIRVAKPGTKFVVGDETEALARKYENLPVTAKFYGNREQAISVPVDLVPPGMVDIQAKDISGGDLYCLSFRKPKSG